MKYLLEISQLSSSRPEKGQILELLELIESGFDRSSAQEKWLELGRSPEGFRQTVMRLKESLLKGVKVQQDKLSDDQRKRIVCWERFSNVKTLLIADKKEAAVELAKDTIRLAEKCGFTEIVSSLAGTLENHYGSIDIDTQSYLRYRAINKKSLQNYIDEHGAYSLSTMLVFSFQRKKDLSFLENDAYNFLKKPEGTYKYKLYRCSFLSNWFQIKGDLDQAAQVIKQTIDSISVEGMILPFTTVTNLYLRLLPYLIGMKRYQEADLYLAKSLSLPTEGSFTYHQLMLQRAMLGFHSDKPSIALDAWSRARLNKAHAIELIDEKWHLVHAYLEISSKISSFKLTEPLSMTKFANRVEHCAQDKQGANVAVIIAKLLIWLLNGDQKAYSGLAKSLTNYIHTHLRGDENVRERCILHMLVKVHENNFFRTRTNLNAQHWVRLIRKHPSQIARESEFIPFEKVWDVVLKRLK